MNTTPDEINPSTPKTILPKILEIAGSASARPTTPPPNPDSNVNSKKKRVWLDKWLNLTQTHPDLSRLEDAVYTFTAGFAKTPGRGQLMVIWGENGCGKTRTAKAIIRWANSVALLLPMVNSDLGFRRVNALFAHWPRVVDGFKKQQFDITEELMKTDLAALDDIGAEHDPSGFGREQLYLVLSRRETLWTVVTTNLVPSQWDTMERRITSRLFRNAVHVDLSRVPDFSTVGDV